MEETVLNTLYPISVLDNAESLLTKFVPNIQASLPVINEMSIMVVGAGTFPSFLSFVKLAKDAVPSINTLKFVLVDPDYTTTDLFNDYFTKIIIPFMHEISIDLTIHNMDLKDYLDPKDINASYDIIYFEHPDSSKFNLLFPSLQSSRLTTSMCESIPYLRNIIKESTIIIGSFIYRDDIQHLKDLLKFSFNIKFKKVKRKSISTGGYFQFGLIGVVKKDKLPNKNPRKLSNDIKLARIIYYIFLLTSVILFLVSPIEFKTVSFYFVVLQLFYHRYGIKNVITKTLFLIAQLSLHLVPFYI